MFHLLICTRGKTGKTSKGSEYDKRGEWDRRMGIWDRSEQAFLASCLSGSNYEYLSHPHLSRSQRAPGKKGGA